MGINAIASPVHNLDLWDAARERPLAFQARQLFLAGYTGRDQDSVRRHIEELAQQGIRAPSRVPELYQVNPLSLQVDGTIWAYDGISSGEVEYVLLVGQNDVYVTVGSDHTDRGLETLAVEKSKQIYSKVLAREVWNFNSLAERWDALTLRSFVVEGHTLKAYQSGTLAQLITVEDLQKLVGSSAQAGTVIFSGTVPIMDGQVRYGSKFIGEIASDDGGVLARCSYNIVTLGEFP